jgi:hypothetical protein
VTIALGYDSGPPGTSAVELVRLVGAGLGAVEAISAATRGSAIAAGILDDVGTVESGKSADLLVVDGEPDKDPTILTDIGRIWLVLEREDERGGDRSSRREAVLRARPSASRKRVPPVPLEDPSRERIRVSRMGVDPEVVLELPPQTPREIGRRDAAAEPSDHREEALRTRRSVRLARAQRR